MTRPTKDEAGKTARNETQKRPYERPAVKVLDKSEVLATFQITSAFASWWF